MNLNIKVIRILYHFLLLNRFLFCGKQLNLYQLFSLMLAMIFDSCAAFGGTDLIETRWTEPA